MADTTNSSNGAEPAGRPGGNPLQNPGAAAGGNDPIVGADAGLTQTENALKPALLPGLLDPTVRKRTVRLGKKKESQIGPMLRQAVKKPGLAPGRDPVALLAEFTLVEQVKEVIPRLRGLSRLAEDTVLFRLSELWTAVLAIYGVAQHVLGDTEVADLVAQMQLALATGPRKQKSVKAAITPIPHGKKALKAALIAHASAVQEPGGSSSPVTPVTPSAPAPAGTVPASEAPATNTNSGTPSSGQKS